MLSGTTRGRGRELIVASRWQVLGRSKNVREYVKIGTETGWIEIELKGLPGKRNLVIRRNLNKDNDTTSFMLDGASCPCSVHANYLLTSFFLLQVSPLLPKTSLRRCPSSTSKSGTSGASATASAPARPHPSDRSTFLPQDRVANFAKLSPAELLEETQKAAGDQRLSQWHKTLIDERVNQAELEGVRPIPLSFDSVANFPGLNLQDVERTAAKLKKEEDKQTQNEKEVKQFEARQKIENEIAVLALLIPYAQYDVARQAYLTTKEERNLLKDELIELEAANKPFQDSYE